jgi:hypothetical protein
MRCDADSRQQAADDRQNAIRGQSPTCCHVLVRQTRHAQRGMQGRSCRQVHACRVQSAENTACLRWERDKDSRGSGVVFHEVKVKVSGMVQRGNKSSIAPHSTAPRVTRCSSRVERALSQVG